MSAAAGAEAWGLAGLASNDPGDIHFDIVLRGYDREQVDERLRFLGDELATAEQALAAARERTAGLEEELASARGELERRVPDPDVGFGNRVEKILRLAEEEAAEIRQRAGTRPRRSSSRPGPRPSSSTPCAMMSSSGCVAPRTCSTSTSTRPGSPTDSRGGSPERRVAWSPRTGED
ncbi:MAG: hypothetical protein GEU83_00855 [Pseudonocardiaceae bacterium]|nr:hypothetical protein [Pseudonocardiaceae bacterium]